MTPCQEPGPLEELRGTVKSYGRHAIALAGWTTWKARIEEQDDLLGSMARSTKDAADRVTPKPKFTATRTEPAGDGIDVLVFPDQVVYRGLTEETWTRVLDQHLVGGTVVEDLSPEPVTGHHITVCMHGARDARCGACGPLLANALEEAIEVRGLEDVHVHRSSHVGGHRFAGNVLVYPGGAWYGYVRPGDVETLLDHVEKGSRWEAHHRGEMVGPQS
ncbi:MAG: sucrase/ferredoxin-like family protein [Candidatus Thermoplasmatota archaeon]|nr:sucrase/ferredoxin-like family protein [Candidatus Thermoplasmatota archaeon]